MYENKIFIRKGFAVCIFFMCTTITLRKNMYFQNLPQLLINQSHLSTKMTMHPHPCTIYLQQSYWKCPPIKNQQSIPFLTTSYQLNMSSSTTSYQLNMSTPPSMLSYTRMLFPFIQAVYSVTLAKLHTFVKVPPTHTEYSFTKQHPYLIKYSDMNQESVSLSPCH